MNRYRASAVGMVAMLMASPLWAMGVDLLGANPTAIMDFMNGHSMVVYLSAFFLLGLLLAFTPCVLPMVPILSGIIVGQQSLSTAKAFRLSLSYVIGMALTYALAGMVAAYLGSTLQTLMQQPWVISVFSLIFVALALNMFGWYELRLPGLMQPRVKTDGKGGMASAAIMGVLSTLIVSPCVTAPLIAVLTYIGQSGQVWLGGLVLFVMALGMGLPLLIVGAGYGALLPKTGVWMIRIKQIFGLMMLAIAVWMMSRILPEAWVRFSWVVLLIIAALQLGVLNTANGFGARLLQGFGVLALMVSGVLGYQMIYGNVLQTGAKAPFKVVHSMEEINKQLALAKASQQPVFIEFFAGWCSDCQAMDKHVFSKTDVQQAMGNSVNIRVDISEKSEAVAALRKSYGIYGIPTMLFFRNDGQPLQELTSVGQIDKGQMMSLLQQFAKQQSIQ